MTDANGKGSSDLDQELKSAQVKKTELETRLIEKQLSKAYQRQESLRTFSSASGLVLAFVAVVAGLLSAFSWVSDRARERELRTQERLERHVAELSAQRVEQRIASMTSLVRFISKDTPERNAQILTSLSNALPLESSRIARATVVTVFASLNADEVGRTALAEGLATLVRNARVARKESPLSGGRGTVDLWDSKLKDDRIELVIDLADAITVLLKKGAQASDLSGLYLAKQDLSGLKLRGAAFDGSILSWANFGSADLRGASFASADLYGAKFVHSDLRGAKLHGRSRIFSAADYTAVASGKDHGGGVKVILEMPNFRCADLREADFEGHSLFGFISDDTTKAVGYYRTPVQFTGANLEGADFRKIGLYAIAKTSDSAAYPFSGCCGGHGFSLGGGAVQMYYWINPDAPLGNEMQKFDPTGRGLVTSFNGSNWRSASLPRWLKEHLDKMKVPDSQDRSGDICSTTEG